MSVVVIDRISIGCPCCGWHNCHLPLDTNRQHFCPKYHKLNNKCAIIGCDRDISKKGADEQKTHVCNDPEHQEIERVRTQKGQARFMLKERLLRQCVSHPEDAIATDVVLDELADVNDKVEEFMVQDTGHVIPDELDAKGNVVPDSSKHTGTKPPKKVHTQFSRKQSHNEQIFVVPCGDIIARETFFRAEAMSSVVMSRATC
jgi:hypothetical protein